MRVSAIPLLALLPFVAAHARIKSPIPLGAPPEDISGNDYNAPLAPDGSQFPCNNLHTNPSVDQTPTTSWKAGSPASFEILGHITAGEGALAAHSGGSCQASISFDNGKSFRVLHTYHGGCPRDVPFGSNLAGPNQTFGFSIPSDTRSGTALFAWTWIAVSGNRDEFYMNCASVDITGSGSSTLDNGDYPSMYVGDMNIPGQIADGECRSTAGTALLYPDPGPKERITVSEVPGIPFMAPSAGRCVAPGAKPGVSSAVSSAVPSSTVAGSASRSASASASSNAPVQTPATPAVLLPTDAEPSPSYAPTEAVPSFISASASSAFTPIPSIIRPGSSAAAVPTNSPAAPPAYTPPAPAYTPTEAVPSFLSSSTPTPPAYTPTNATPSFLSSVVATASSCVCKSTATFTITLAGPPPPPTATPTPIAIPAVVEEEAVVTLTTTITTTVCPEASLAAICAEY